VAREPSWQTVAAALADRMQHQAHCGYHRETEADPDCAPCRDRAAFRMWQQKAGIALTSDVQVEDEVIDVFAHARGAQQYRAFAGETATYGGSNHVG
jgi:hypothetical protein